MSTGLYQPSDEWEARHDNLVAWHNMWHSLFQIFSVLGLIVIVILHDVSGSAFCGLGGIFYLAMVICEVRHIKLHEEAEQ